MSTLPQLPKKRKTREADFGLEIRQWIEKVRPLTSAYELKTTRGKDRFFFAELADLQIHHGLKIEGKGDLIRVAAGTPGAPDYIWLKDEDYYVVIDFPQGFVMIRLKPFIEESNSRSSMLFERACEIAHYHKKKRG